MLVRRIWTLIKITSVDIPLHLPLLQKSLNVHSSGQHHQNSRRFPVSLTEIKNTKTRWGTIQPKNYPDFFHAISLVNATYIEILTLVRRILSHSKITTVEIPLTFRFCGSPSASILLDSITTVPGDFPVPLAELKDTMTRVGHDIIRGVIEDPLHHLSSHSTLSSLSTTMPSVLRVFGVRFIPHRSV